MSAGTEKILGSRINFTGVLEKYIASLAIFISSLAIYISRHAIYISSLAIYFYRLFGENIMRADEFMSGLKENCAARAEMKTPLPACEMQGEASVWYVAFYACLGKSSELSP